jgi:RNA polymerase sigma-70 factor (ECF subfamily)
MSFAAAQPVPTHSASHPPDHVSPFQGHSLKPLSDDALVSRTRAGDLGAFEELLARHEENLLRLAFRFVRNEHDAQEVLQDVFVTTWRKLPGFQDRAQIGSWLYRVTVNASLMHLRVRKRRPECVDLAPVARSTKHDFERDFDLDIGDRHRPDAQLESEELRRVIQAAIERLPLSLRSVFEIREIQGWSTRQTAKLLSLSEATVKTRLHRARRMLREKVEGYLLQ